MLVLPKLKLPKLTKDINKISALIRKIKAYKKTPHFLGLDSDKRRREDRNLLRLKKKVTVLCAIRAHYHGKIHLATQYAAALKGDPTVDLTNQDTFKQLSCMDYFQVDKHSINWLPRRTLVMDHLMERQSLFIGDAWIPYVAE